MNLLSLLAAYASAIRDRFGECIGWVITGHDLRPTLQLKHEVTERQKAREALRQLNEDLEARIIRRTNQLELANRELGRIISERQLIAEELKQSEKRLRQITDNMLDMICQTDTAFKFEYMSPTYLTAMGYAPEQILGRSIFDFVHPDDIENVQAAVNYAIQHSTSGKVELRYRHSDGHYLWLESFGNLIFDDERRIIGAVFSNRDITQRKQDEAEKHHLQQMQIEALQQADRFKDEFLSVISHELRTPLNSITGFSSLLKDEVCGPLNEEQNDFLGKILTASDRMLSLVNDLLDVARIQAGKFEIYAREVSYPALVEEATLAMLPLSREKGLTLTLDVDGVSTVSVDPQKTYQVLVNLLSNAIKFTPQGGQIEVRASLRDEYLVTEVADTGIGLAMEDIPKLFLPFKQLDMTLTRQVGGTGLGLSICRAIVDAHGGSIDANSPGINGGSTFRFVLPLKPSMD